MAKPDFSGNPFDRLSPTEGGVGDDALVSHMRAFLKASKAGDPAGMATAFKAAHEECASYGDDEGAEGDGISPTMADAMEPNGSSVFSNNGP